MHNYMRIDRPDLYFVADMHFRSRAIATEVPRRDRFRRFLEAVGDDAALFLLGDIFDFYFEYGSVIPKRYFDIFQALYNCTRRGVDIHFIGGNHDYWTGDFLRRELGVRLHPDDFYIASQDRRICCSHGDFRIPGEPGYKVLRSVMRNPVMIALAKIIHPDLMDVIASGVSKESKKRKRRTQEEIATLLGEMAPQSFFNEGNDVFVMGHVHYPLHRTENQRDFVIVGDWISTFTYAHLRSGRITLETFEAATV
jgi:UDP-2,3-diacylglucosamine hydrolase